MFRGRISKVNGMCSFEHESAFPRKIFLRSRWRPPGQNTMRLAPIRKGHVDARPDACFDAGTGVHITHLNWDDQSAIAQTVRTPECKRVRLRNQRVVAVNSPEYRPSFA